MSGASTSSPRSVAVVGAGSIGMAWSAVFAAAGFAVSLHDPDTARLVAAKQEAASRLADLSEFGLLSGSPSEISERIDLAKDLEAAVRDSNYIQECAPEGEALKRDLFTQLARLAREDAVIASSSSFLPASRFAGEAEGRERCLVVHPGNPPYLLRVAEIVPAPFTSAATVERAETTLVAAGMTPIRLGHEVDGFVFNRLQGAVLREAYCLVRDGVASAADIDRIVRDGLGLRWSLIGPFETADLNTRGGIAAHAKRMGPAYRRMGAERGEDDPWTDDLVERVEAERRLALPLDRWAERTEWRDRALMALLRARRADPALRDDPE